MKRIFARFSFLYSAQRNYVFRFSEGEPLRKERKNRAPTIISIGKITAARIPYFIADPPEGKAGNAWGMDSAISETIPAIHGPREAPISPNTASIPNMADPPFGKAAAERLKVPGHMRDTEKPQKAHPKRERNGQGANTVVR